MKEGNPNKYPLVVPSSDLIGEYRESSTYRDPEMDRRKFLKTALLATATGFIAIKCGGDGGHGNSGGGGGGGSPMVTEDDMAYTLTSNYDIFARDIGGGQPRVIIGNKGLTEYGFDLSPSRKFIAYVYENETNGMFVVRVVKNKNEIEEVTYYSANTKLGAPRFLWEFVNEFDEDDFLLAFEGWGNDIYGMERHGPGWSLTNSSIKLGNPCPLYVDGKLDEEHMLLTKEEGGNHLIFKYNHKTGIMEPDPFVDEGGQKMSLDMSSRGWLVYENMNGGDAFVIRNEKGGLVKRIEGPPGTIGYTRWFTRSRDNHLMIFGRSPAVLEKADLFLYNVDDDIEDKLTDTPDDSEIWPEPCV